MDKLSHTLPVIEHVSFLTFLDCLLSFPTKGRYVRTEGS